MVVPVVSVCPGRQFELLDPINGKVHGLESRGGIVKVGRGGIVKMGRGGIVKMVRGTVTMVRGTVTMVRGTVTMVRGTVTGKVTVVCSLSISQTIPSRSSSRYFN